MAKKIKMLKPGTFTAMNGQSYSFSEQDLRATAAAYDPTLFAAPIVKGHPEHDAPAYGRIYAAEFAEGCLVGTPGKVDPAFAEEVNSGRFDNVSLSLYPPDHPSNPVPGVFYPRHLGFLGAMPPAVKGMGQVSLSENEEGIISFSEMNMVAPSNSKETKHMAVKDRASFCGDCGDHVCIPCCPVDAITMTAEKGAVIDPAKCTVCYKCIDACRMMCDPVYGMQVANYAEKEQEVLKADNVAFADKLIAAGKLLPARKPAIVALLNQLGSGDSIEFGEGEARVTATSLDTFKQFLESGPKVIEFGELGAGEEPGNQQKAIPANIATLV